MLTRFRTETGSLYEIDHEKKTWARLEAPSYEGVTPLRTKEGTYNEVSPIEIGRPVNFICPPFVPEAAARYITTSPVAEISGEPLKSVGATVHDIGCTCDFCKMRSTT